MGYEYPLSYGNAVEVYGEVGNHWQKPVCHNFWKGYFWDGGMVYKHRLARYKNGMMRLRLGPQFGAVQKKFFFGLEAGFEYSYVFRSGLEFSVIQKNNVNFLHGDTFRNGLLAGDKGSILVNSYTVRSDMAFEETREQQQMYNYFRSCIYIFLIIEIIMNLPVTADNRVTQFVLDLLARFRVFNSVSGCKVAELVCICIVCIGTKAEKSLKFNVRTMVIYPVLAGLTLVGLCFVFHGMSFGFSWLGFPANRLLYAVCSVVGTMLVHQGLDGIAKYYNYKVGEDRFNFENESFQQSETLVSNDYSVNIPMIYYWKKKMHKGWINIINPFRGTIVLGTPGSGKSFGIIDRSSGSTQQRDLP